MKILLVDDEEDIIEFLSYNLEKEGFIVTAANDGVEAVEMAKKHTPDIIVMDVMMPKMDGIEACARIRNTPGLENSYIMFLTARGEEYSQVAGFESGGDAYMVKPIQIKVLVARIKRVAEKMEVKQTEIEDFNKGGLRILYGERLVYVSDQSVHLPRKEFAILKLLAEKCGRIYSRDQIYASVWGSDTIVSDRTLDVHIRKLREKIGEKKIRTIKGIGYSLDLE